jgi:peptidoglycan/xylan/chitin deacetylase (PgdA/CDA1 family)
MNIKEAGGKIVAGGLSLSFFLLPGCNSDIAQANEKIPSAIEGEIIPGINLENENIVLSEIPTEIRTEKETEQKKEVKIEETTIPEIEVVFESKPVIVVEKDETTSIETTIMPTKIIEIIETKVESIEITTTPEKKADPSVIVYHGNTTKAEVALTFDDAGAGLGKILDICNQKGIKATFFLLACELETNPERWRKAVEDGHQICNHTVSHSMSLSKLSEEKIKKDVLGWEKVAKKVLGDDYVERMKKDFPYFRSPGGNSSKRLQQVLGDLGYPITAYWGIEDCWSLSQKKKADEKKLSDNPDYISESNSSFLTRYYSNNANNGTIFLMHGGRWGLISDIIDNIEDRGYKCKLLSEILD